MNKKRRKKLISFRAVAILNGIVTVKLLLCHCNTVSVGSSSCLSSHCGTSALTGPPATSFKLAHVEPVVGPRLPRLAMKPLASFWRRQLIRAANKCAGVLILKTSLLRGARLGISERSESERRAKKREANSRFAH